MDYILAAPKRPSLRAVNGSCLGTKSEMATSPLPSRGPKRGWKCYVMLAFSGIPNANRREQTIRSGPKPRVRNGCLTPAFSRAQKGGDCYIAPVLSGIPNAKRGEQKVNSGAKKKENNIRFGYPTPTFTGAEERAEMLRHPCILGDPQRQAWGAKNK